MSTTTRRRLSQAFGPQALSTTRRGRGGRRTKAAPTTTRRRRAGGGGGRGRAGGPSLLSVLAAGAVGLGAYFLLTKEASAAPAMPLLGVPGAAGAPGAPGAAGAPGSVSVSIPSPQATAARVTPVTPGRYRIIAPSGLRVRTSSNYNTAGTVTSLAAGTLVDVVADAGNGWAQISSANGRPVSGFICYECPQINLIGVPVTGPQIVPA